MVRPHKEMVGGFNITANLDHLDYHCVVVAGSVHVLSVQSGHFGMRNESILRFKVGLSLGPAKKLVRGTKIS